MGDILGDILPYAIGVAISPIPIIAVILMLFSARAKSNGLAFVIGWMIGLTTAGGIILVLANAGVISPAADNSEPSTTMSLMHFGLGILLLLLAYRNWQKRPEAGEESEMPKWMAGIEGFTPIKAFGIAFLLSAVNPKNLSLTVAAALVLVQANLDGGNWLLLFLFIVIASLTVAGPVVYFLIAGSNAEEQLTKMKVWLGQNNAVVMAVLLLVLGVKLTAQGLGNLLA